MKEKEIMEDYKQLIKPTKTQYVDMPEMSPGGGAL